MFFVYRKFEYKLNISQPPTITTTTITTKTSWFAFNYLRNYFFRFMIFNDLCFNFIFSVCADFEKFFTAIIQLNNREYLGSKTCPFLDSCYEKFLPVRLKRLFFAIQGMDLLVVDLVVAK